jgi:hypothetical protein
MSGVTSKQYSPAALIDPRPNGYLHIAAEIDPPARPGPVRPTNKIRETLTLLAPTLAQLSTAPEVTSVEAFRAAAFPPLAALPIPDRHRDAARRYDLIVLIQTRDPSELDAIDDTPGYAELQQVLHTRARHVTITPARNVKRIADVPAGDSLHLFNHFLAEDPSALDQWDQLAGWYQQEMGLTNSEVLAPLKPDSTPFAFINHASWNLSVPRFIVRQLSHPSFRTYVIANLRANQIGTLPYLYRPIPAPR